MPIMFSKTHILLIMTKTYNNYGVIVMGNVGKQEIHINDHQNKQEQPQEPEYVEFEEINEESGVSVVPEACTTRSNASEIPDVVRSVFVQPKMLYKYVKQMIETYYQGNKLNLACIYRVLDDYALIVSVGNYKKFVEALIAWELIDKMDSSAICSISQQLGAYMRDRTDRGKLKKGLCPNFKQWDATDDRRSFCYNIANVLESEGSFFHYKY